MRFLRRGRGSCSLRCFSLLAAAAAGCIGHTQNCTTQSRMSAQQRTELGNAAYTLASAVQAGDTSRVQASTVAQYAGDPGQAAYLVRSTGQQLAGDTLAVTQLYLLDGSARKPGDTAEAEFSCPLAGTVAETDFGIAGLPPGRFAFAMVEARGTHPWLLAFLLQQEGGTWKMAGFYPHARTSAGHDGVWYWSAARTDAKGNKPWLAWVLYTEADALLRPASFVSTSNLDKLRGEQRSAAPEPLTNGLSTQTPLSVSGADGTVYRVTDLAAQGSDDGTELNLLVRLHVDGPATAADAATARNVGAARALLTAHPELRDGFANVLVIAEGGGAGAFTVKRPMAEVTAGSAAAAK